MLVFVSSIEIPLDRQEPTVVPSRYVPCYLVHYLTGTDLPSCFPSNSLLDLCSFIVCHRFFSAGWFGHLAKHVSTELDADAFERVVLLDVSRTGAQSILPRDLTTLMAYIQRGECLIFSPTSLFLTAPEEIEDGRGGAWANSQSKGAWGATSKGDWAEPINASPNNDSGWGSGPVALPESASGQDDGGWGNFFAKKLSNGPASPAAPVDVLEKKVDVDSKDSSGDIPSDTSSADDDIDIIIRDSDSVTEGVIKLHSDKAVDTSNEKASLNGWNAAPARTKPVEREVGQLGRGHIVAKTRRRITDDGGRSILATDQ